jgi:hypothetical protein
VDFKIFADAHAMYAAYDTGTAYEYDSNLPGARLPEAKSQPDYHQGGELAI